MTFDKGRVKRVEFFFDVTEPEGDEFSPEEMDELGSQYEKKLAECAVHAEKTLGKPDKRGEKVSWKLPSARITLSWNNAGSIVPFWISVVVTK